MNPITHAFKTAGVKLPPLNKRIWLWLHDHPNKTYAEVAKAINEKPSNVSSQLGLMVQRGMVSMQRLPRRASKGSATVSVYNTSIKTFELLPMPYVPKAKPVAAVPQAVNTTPTAPALSKPVQSVLDGYTLKELRQIRDALNRLFEYI